MGTKKTEEQRFWEKVQKTDSCWLWTGSKRSKGYGAFVFVRNGEVIQGRAHRYSYELRNGQIPEGLFVLHLCDVPACVNPDHLFLGTNKDNVDDMVKKGRHVAGGTYQKGNGKYKKGEDHPSAKITADTVVEIRKDREGGMSFSRLSKKYHLCISYIFRIVKRTAWSHVE